MGWFGKSGDQPIDFETLSPPWDKQRLSIYSHIKSHLLPDTQKLDTEGQVLPDEDELSKTSKLRFVAGGLDGAFGHHGQPGQEKELAGKITKALTNLLNTGNAKSVREFYELLLSSSTIDFIDPFMQEFLELHDVSDPSLYAFAKWLVKNTPDREPLKTGIALLGVCATDEDKNLFLEIGTHEEFTLYCAVALSHSTADAEAALWELGKKVHGWGRIHIVERLAETEDEEIKAWLLRDGYNNSIMPEYTALTCATAGDLLTALSLEHPDAELLAGATAIVAAMIRGGPAPGIDDYADAAPAVHRMLFLLEHEDASLEQFVHLLTIREYVSTLDPAEEDIGDWESVFPHVWDMCNAILDRPDWESKVLAALERQDEPEFWYAREVASSLKIDTWEITFKRVQNGKPEWYFVMQTKDENRLRRALAFAEESLPLETIAGGVADELGMGPEYRPHRDLDAILQELRDWPGHGLKLIRTGLHSPVVRNRHLALVALKTWGRNHWESDIEEELISLQRDEPDEKTRQLIVEILSKE